MEQQTHKIHKYIIKSAPYGQLTEVLKDLEKVSQVDLRSSHIIEAVQKYNEEHLALFHLNTSPSPFLVMPIMRVSDNQYLDQINKDLHTVDHFTQQILNTQKYEVELVQGVDDLLRELNKVLTGYTKKYYKDPVGHSVFMELSEQTGLTVHIGITGKNVNLGNFYTGEWISYWKVTKQQIKGQVSVNAHFFEAGNVQLHEKKKTASQFQYSQDMAESAKKIVKVIQNFQCLIQTGLSDVYEKMPSSFFKNLRRVAPITQVKMNWNLNSIVMNQNLMKVTNK